MIALGPICLLHLPTVLRKVIDNYFNPRLTTDQTSSFTPDDDVSDLGPKEVAVRILFAPINPSDINQVQPSKLICIFPWRITGGDWQGLPFYF